MCERVKGGADGVSDVDGRRGEEVTGGKLLSPARMRFREGEGGVGGSAVGPPRKTRTQNTSLPFSLLDASLCSFLSSSIIF